MPTCNDPCGNKKPHPEIVETAPEPIKNIVLNLDVILTSILHELNPTQEYPEYDLPDPGTDTEIDFVHNVLNPIVIQLLNDDITPAIPTCTFPDGTSASDWGLAEES